MKKNPVIPYLVIAIIGVLAVIVISFVGAEQREAIQNEEEGTEQSAEGGEGEVSGDPEAAYANSCASCHGADLTGGMGPDLTTIGSKYSSEEIADIINNGKGAMPALGLGEEATVIADWLSEKQ